MLQVNKTSTRVPGFLRFLETVEEPGRAVGYAAGGGTHCVEAAGGGEKTLEKETRSPSANSKLGSDPEA